MQSHAHRLAREEYILQLPPELRLKLEQKAAKDAEVKARIEKQVANRPIRQRTSEHYAALRSRMAPPPLHPDFYKNGWLS